MVSALGTAGVIGMVSVKCIKCLMDCVYVEIGG